MRRAAVRVLLLDPAGRVLLLHVGGPAPYWFTVGGGLAPGETPRGAAVREVAEETGHVLAAEALVGPGHAEVVELVLAGVATRQEQDFYAAAAPSTDVDLSGLEPAERAVVDGARWWSADELDATAEAFHPAGLAALLRAVLARPDLRVGC